jgi:hypothetical protein
MPSSARSRRGARAANHVPITYEIDRARGLMRTHCRGVVTFSEVVEHFRQLHADPEVPERIHVILDLRELRTSPDRDQLRAIASEVKDLKERLRWGALAIVAESDLLFGMSRVFGVFAEGYFSQINVFRSEPEALRWLEAPRAAGRTSAA